MKWRWNDDGIGHANQVRADQGEVTYHWILIVQRGSSYSMMGIISPSVSPPSQKASMRKELNTMREVQQTASSNREKREWRTTEGDFDYWLVVCSPLRNVCPLFSTYWLGSINWSIVGIWETLKGCVCPRSMVLSYTAFASWNIYTLTLDKILFYQY